MNKYQDRLNLYKDILKVISDEKSWTQGDNMIFYFHMGQAQYSIHGYISLYKAAEREKYARPLCVTLSIKPSWDNLERWHKDPNRTHAEAIKLVEDTIRRLERTGCRKP